jgi:hypothetical protein
MRKMELMKLSLPLNLLTLIILSIDKLQEIHKLFVKKWANLIRIQHA